jgi:hypothetical protein
MFPGPAKPVSANKLSMEWLFADARGLLALSVREC